MPLVRLAKAAVLAVLCLVAACGDNLKHDPKLVSIALTPSSSQVAAGTGVQLTATATYEVYPNKMMVTRDVTDSVTWSSAADTTATVSSAGFAKGLVKGTAEINASLVENGATVSGSMELTVTDAELVTLVVTPPAPSIAKGFTQALVATGTFTDATTQDLTTQVTWSSSDVAVATISNASPTQGRASTLQTGTTTIKATMGTISGTATLTVTAAVLVSITVTPPDTSIAKGTSQQLTATGTFSDNTTQNLTTTATWTSSMTSVATFATNNGLAASVDTGTTTITANVGTVSGTTMLTVTDAELVSLSVTPPDPSVPLGRTKQFTAIGTYTDNTTQDLTAQVVWDSGVHAVATVSNAATTHGLASTHATGSTSITATLGTITGSTTLTVTDAVLVSLAVTPADPSIAKGTSQQFQAIGTFSDNTTQILTTAATWSSSDMNVAVIGPATGLAVTSLNTVTGSTTITAQLGAITGTTTLTVTDAVLVSIVITPPDPSIAKGTSQQFAATGTYSDSSTQDLTTSATWSSSNTNVAIIGPTTGLASTSINTVTGATTIKAQIGAIFGTTTLTVTDAVLVSIAVTPPDPSIAKGTSQQFVATGTYSDSSTQNLTTAVTWSSSNTNVATISPTGGLASTSINTVTGSTTIKAQLGAISGTTTLTVTSAVLVSIAVTPVDPSIAKGTSQQFTATGTYSDSSIQDLTTTATWSSSNTNVAAISPTTGLATTSINTVTGSTTIKAQVGAISDTTTLTVTDAVLVSLAITPPDPSIAKGTSQQFTATGTYSDSSTQDLTTAVAWSSSNTSVATIAPTTGLASTSINTVTGMTTIKAQEGAIVATTTLTVTPAFLVSLDVTPANPTIPKGTSQQFTATGTYSDGSTQDLTAAATWSSSDTTVATISNTSPTNGRASTSSLTVTGTTNITAKVGTISDTTTLTVSPAVLTSIVVTPAVVTIANGTSQQFTADGVYSDNTTQNLTTSVTWSSDSSGLTILNATGSQGLATANASSGTVIVTAKDPTTQISGTATVTLSNAILVAIQVDPPNESLARGSTEFYTATGIYSDNSTQDLTAAVTWSTGSTAIATVSNAANSEGTVTAVAPGTTTIKALDVATGIFGTTNLTVLNTMLVSITVTPSTTTIAKGARVQYTATATYDNGTTRNITQFVSWSSSSPNVASVSNGRKRRGVATGKQAGTVTITATDPATLISGTATLTVSTATLTSLTISPVDSTIPNRTKQYFIATGHFSDGTTSDLTAVVDWTSTNTSVATISNQLFSAGVATGTSAGVTTIRATDPTTLLTASTTLTVTSATLVSTAITPADPTMIKGSIQQLTATGTFSDASTKDLTLEVTWTTANTAIATITNAGSTKGTASAIGVGSTVISAAYPQTAIVGTTGVTVVP